mmetsp:Transcript_16833/g.43318  ORF Transcript_16833/g.43318 Transcript_16833/m.43318 type:complete len:214 (+) Transcript_16833:16-657(+)
MSSHRRFDDSRNHLERCGYREAGPSRCPRKVGKWSHQLLLSLHLQHLQLHHTFHYLYRSYHPLHSPHHSLPLHPQRHPHLHSNMIPPWHPHPQSCYHPPLLPLRPDSSTPQYHHHQCCWHNGLTTQQLESFGFHEAGQPRYHEAGPRRYQEAGPPRYREAAPPRYHDAGPPRGPRREEERVRPRCCFGKCCSTTRSAPDRCSSDQSVSRNSSE